MPINLLKLDNVKIFELLFKERSSAFRQGFELIELELVLKKLE